MSKKKYLLMCNSCDYKKVTDAEGVQKLYEYPTNQVQKGIPLKNEETGKLDQPQMLPVKRKFRCEKCGRAIVAREIADVQANLDQKLELERRMKEIEDEKNRIVGRETGSEGFKIP